MNYQRIYEYRFKGIAPLKKSAVWKQISGKIFDLMEKPGKVLDPAGGQLEFIGHIPAKDRWVVDLVQYDSVFAKDRIKFIQGSIFDVDLPASYFDGVFLSNFLEHLASPEEISCLLEKLFKHMEPGGRIAIMGPNFKYTTKVYFDCADHILPLTHVSVAEHLHAAGFSLKRVVPRFIPYSFRGHLPVNSSLTALYLKMPLAWPIFGRQFLLIAEKPSS